MNKQELIDYCNAIKENKSQIINCIDVNGIIKKIEQLDEPEKVKVPQFVADWIEKCKSIKQFITSLAYALNSEVWSENSLSDECIDWLYKAGNQDIFALAWINGYEVEKEKQYKVRMKYIENNMKYIVFGKYSESWFLESENESSNIRTHHTREQLEKAGFGEVFNSPLFEVEEV